jgi:hypothetical protein
MQGASYAARREGQRRGSCYNAEGRLSLVAKAIRNKFKETLLDTGPQLAPELAPELFGSEKEGKATGETTPP